MLIDEDKGAALLCSVALSLELRETLQSAIQPLHNQPHVGKILNRVKWFVGCVFLALFVLKCELYLHLTGNQLTKLTYDSDQAQATLSASNELEALDITCTQTCPCTQLLEVPRRSPGFKNS